jgi:hypothetical protein
MWVAPCSIIEGRSEHAAHGADVLAVRIHCGRHREEMAEQLVGAVDQWFVKEQLEEVSSMDQLLRVVQHAGEANLLRVEEYLAREKSHGTASVREEETEAG